MKKKIFLLYFILFSILLVILFFSSNKIRDGIIKNQKYFNLKYTLENTDGTYLKIKLDDDSLKTQKSYYNKFAKENFITTSLLIETSTDCKRNRIFLNSIYNFSPYSNVYKISVIDENLQINIHNSDNNLNFLYFLINENQIKCIKNIFLVEGKKLPYEYFIIKKNKIIKKNIKKFKEPFAFNMAQLIKKDDDALIDDNIISLHKRYSTLNASTQLPTINSVYYKNVEKTYFLNRDIYLATINTEKIQNYYFECKILVGKINILFFDKESLEIIDFENCYQNKNFYINLPKRKKINILINAKIEQHDSLESKFKIIIFKQSD